MNATISLGRIERTRPHLLADTAEIALVFGMFSQISEADLVSVLRQSPMAAKDLPDVDDPDVDDDGQDDNLGGAEISAREQRYIEDCIRQFEFRTSAFGDSYPFELRDNILYYRGDGYGDGRLYVFLLCCARTRSFKSRKIVQNLSEEFEEVSAVALSKMMAARATIVRFGAAARTRSDDFSNNLIEAIPQLAKRMGCQLGNRWKQNLNPQGDGKIDLVAIFALDEYSDGYHVIIAQCASIEDENDWQKKRQEASMAAMRGFFHVLVEAQAALFIPACFRMADGTWVDDNDVSNVIPMDRLRIIKVLKDDNHAYDADAALRRAEVIKSAVVAR